MNESPRILVMTRYRTGKQMASPGIRAFHIARVLAEQVPGAQVALATASADELANSSLPFDAVPYTQAALTKAVWRSDIIIGSRFPLYLFPLLYTKRVVLDMFTPFVTEWIELAKWWLRADTMMEPLTSDLMLQLLMADLVLCANARQRDLYFGMLSSLGRITADVYDKDHWLKNMLAIAPYGVRPDEPRQTRRVLKGVRPGIEETDTVFIWNGAVVEWYDVETLVRAVHCITRQRSDIKLFFLGTEHPDNPKGTSTQKLEGLGGGVAKSAYDLSRGLGLLDTSVFFNFDWVDYDDTANFLCEADAGVCTYFNNLETRFSFRSRILDLLWAERPILCTEGDVWAEAVNKRPLGVAVPERNEDEMVAAMLRLADDREFVSRCKANLREEKAAYRWERILEQLIDYCRLPAVPTRKASRLLPMTTTFASSLQAKGRVALYKRLDRINFPWTRPLPQQPAAGPLGEQP